MLQLIKFINKYNLDIFSIKNNFFSYFRNIIVIKYKQLYLFILLVINLKIIIKKLLNLINLFNIWVFYIYKIKNIIIIYKNKKFIFIAF